MDPVRKRQLIIFCGIFGLLLLIGIFLSIILGNENTNQQNIDDMSNNSARQDLIDTPQEPTYINFEELTDIGLTSDQLRGFQYALFKYTELKEIEATSYNIIPNTVEDAFSENESGVFVMSFDISVNDSDVLKAKLERSELTIIQLSLFNADGGQVFDSGRIDTFELSRSRQNNLVN